ncbi:MAG: MFS transporter, partial [Gammaproteobacteria bacterium]|nr:MFS transporter [Gammaproteobacteria bacterium]
MFWVATAVSLTGDQLTFIALPWLVLKLTGDPLVMGMVIAVAAVPRALFMLVGGAVTDKYSPRIVMILSNFVRMLLIALLAFLTFNQQIEIWMVFAIGFAFGLADAFMFPAAGAFPPRLLETDRLAAGNSLIQGTAQLTLVIGPMIAALLIAWFGVNKIGIADVAALAPVFALDALSFIVPIAALSAIRERFPPALVVAGKIWDSLVEGLRYTWNDMPLRTFALLLGVLTLVFRGPFVVGIP